MTNAVNHFQGPPLHYYFSRDGYSPTSHEAPVHRLSFGSLYFSDEPDAPRVISR